MQPVFFYRRRGNPERKWAEIRHEILRKLTVFLAQERRKMEAEARMPLFPENESGKRSASEEST